MKFKAQNANGVAAGVPPAVEPGVPPCGMDVNNATVLENLSAGPGGKMPPSTAGGMPAATARGLFTALGRACTKTAKEKEIRKTPKITLHLGAPTSKLVVWFGT